KPGGLRGSRPQEVRHWAPSRSEGWPTVCLRASANEDALPRHLRRSDSPSKSPGGVGMRAWRGVVGGLVLAVAGCGPGTGVSKVDRAGQTGGQGGQQDGGQPSCTQSPASFLANAGTGSACGQKPVLGTPVSFDENVPDGGECFAV